MNKQIYNKIKEYFPKLSKEIVLIFLGQVIAVLGSQFGVRMLTGKLSPSIYGEISLALTIGVLFQEIIFGPLSGSFLRFFSIARERNEMNVFCLRRPEYLNRWGTTICKQPE